jgi:hypothetical protein
MTARPGLTTGAMMLPSLLTARPRCNFVECCDSPYRYTESARRWRDDRGTPTLCSSTESNLRLPNTADARLSSGPSLGAGSTSNHMSK